MFIAIKLAKKGYFCGNPETVLSSPVDVVQSILDYENFEIAYEKEYIEKNKQD